MSLCHSAAVSASEHDRDRALIERALIDPDAFTELYRIHRPAVYRFALDRVNGDHTDAEDVTAETFLAAWRALPRLDMTRPELFSSWLLAVAGRRAITQLTRRGVLARRRDATGRSYKTLPELKDVDEVPVSASGPSPEEAVIRQDQGRRLRAALAQLPDTHRQVLVLRFEEGLTREAVASMTGLGWSIESIERNALKALRWALDEESGDGQVASCACGCGHPVRPDGQVRYALPRCRLDACCRHVRAYLGGDRSEEARRVGLALATLAPRRRQAIAMKSHGATNPEMQVALQTTEVAVKNLVQQAVRALWRAVEESRGVDLDVLEDGRRCACGCGRALPGGYWQLRRYASPACRSRAQGWRRIERREAA